MKSPLRPTRVRLAPLAAALLLTLAPAGLASASSETLRRATTNILFSPFDVVLSPITSGRVIYTNLQEIDDTPGVRIVYVVPGFAWNTAIQIGGGVLRFFSGLLELPVGIVLLPFEADMDPIFSMAERGDALVDEDYDWIYVKFGINYVN